MRHHQLLHGQFARVVKGVDLRSTAGNCAWARSPQLTCNKEADFDVNTYATSCNMAISTWNFRARPNNAAWGRLPPWLPVTAARAMGPNKKRYEEHAQESATL